VSLDKSACDVLVTKHRPNPFDRRSVLSVCSCDINSRAPVAVRISHICAHPQGLGNLYYYIIP